MKTQGTEPSATSSRQKKLRLIIAAVVAAVLLAVGVFAYSTVSAGASAEWQRKSGELSILQSRVSEAIKKGESLYAKSESSSGIDELRANLRRAIDDAQMRLDLATPDDFQSLADSLSTLDGATVVVGGISGDIPNIAPPEGSNATSDASRGELTFNSWRVECRRTTFNVCNVTLDISNNNSVAVGTGTKGSATINGLDYPSLFMNCHDKASGEYFDCATPLKPGQSIWLESRFGGLPDQGTISITHLDFGDNLSANVTHNWG